jgi:DNA invertase Pin-like site-specific DNA recombinase
VIASSDGARLVGYARVSTDGQDLALQIDALRNHGVAKELIFTDKASGAKYDRPGLDAGFRELRSGDILLVWRLDRLGRSVRHLVTLIDQLRERNVGFRSVCDGAIDTTTPSGELIFHVFSALAQFERRLIHERTMAGLAAARVRGRTGGRPPLRPNDPKFMLANKLFADKSVELDDICETLKISKTTLYRYVEIGTGVPRRLRDRSR